MPGLFITFEGLDGSGKTTHLARVASRFEALGVPHETTHEPGGTPLGDEIRRTFLDPRWGRLDGGVELLLMFASRRQHLMEVIEPALAAGRHVLCDRFTDSSYAYQGGGRGVADDLIERIDRVATGGRMPDRTLLFDLPAPLARRRRHSDDGRRGRHRSRGRSDSRRSQGAADRLDGEDLSFYERVRARFLERAAAEPERFRRIDSSGEIEATWRHVVASLSDLLPGLGGGGGGA